MINGFLHGMSSFLGRNHIVGLDLAQVSSTAESEKYQLISHISVDDNVGKIQSTKLIQNVYRSSCTNEHCLDFDILTKHKVRGYTPFAKQRVIFSTHKEHNCPMK